MPAAGTRTAGPISLTDMLRELVEQAGPPPEVDRERCAELATTIGEHAVRVITPAPFPAVAQRVLQIAGQPETDLNELVGVVQRDAAVAAALLRVANSAAYRTQSSVTTLRAALGLLGMQTVVEVVMGTTGADMFAATPRDRALFPGAWETMFQEAMANAFTAGRLALEHPAGRGERALLAGLLTDIGAPTALRALIHAVRVGIPTPEPHLATAAIDTAAVSIRDHVLGSLGLPAELLTACIPDRDLPSLDAQLAQLASAIGAIQRRSTRMWACAADVRAIAERMQIAPLVLRSWFGLRAQERMRVHEML